MNHEAKFAAWAARAAEESPPRLDVAAGVLERIEARPARREFELPWTLFSTVAVLAASLVLVVALDRWQSLTDPLATMFSALTLVMQ